MGKQISFFMTANDELSFIEFIKKNNDVIVDKSGNKVNEIGELVSYISGKRLDSTTIGKIFIMKTDSKIFIKKNGFVDDTLSEVIEFSRCEIVNDNELWNGRIWFQTKYYDEKGELIKKT